MKAFLIRPVLAAVLAAGAWQGASAQNVLRPSDSKTVEVIGLEDWTLAMLQDSVRKYGDGVPLDSYACAQVLRGRLGFADASVQRTRMVGPGPAREYVAVSVVEPTDSVRVRRRAVGRDTLGFPRGWEGMETLLRRHGIVGFALVNGLREGSPEVREDSAAVRRAWAFVNGQQTADGYTFAARVLDAHPNYHARVLAAAILREAPADDALLYTLLRAMRDDVDMVGNLAGPIAARMAAQRPGFDWAPAAADVHAMLNGTALYSLNDLLRALSASGVDGRMAAPFLAGGGHAVLARLGSEEPRMWAGAHRLLVALRGEDLGRDPAAWRAWIDSLAPVAAGGN